MGSGAQIRLFDITLNLKNGQHSFSGIDKKELEIIMEYFNSRKIPVKTVNEFNNEVEVDESDDEDAGEVKYLRKSRITHQIRAEEERESQQRDPNLIWTMMTKMKKMMILLLEMMTMSLMKKTKILMRRKMKNLRSHLRRSNFREISLVATKMNYKYVQVSIKIFIRVILG